jgi:hypothetical protein
MSRPSSLAGDGAMEDDPYLEMIDEQWDSIIAMYRTFAGKKQIIEYNVTTQKLYFLPHRRLHSQLERENERYGGHESQSVSAFRQGHQEAASAVIHT